MIRIRTPYFFLNNFFQNFVSLFQFLHSQQFQIEENKITNFHRLQEPLNALVFIASLVNGQGTQQFFEILLRKTPH